MPWPNLSGAPVKYNDDVPEKLEGYILEAAKRGSVVSRAGFALYIGISRSTLYEWEKKYKKLSDTLKVLDTIQEQELIDNGLRGTYNATLTKLMLSNHGYSDRQEVKSETTSLNYDIASDDPEEKLQDVLQRIKRLRNQE